MGKAGEDRSWLCPDGASSDKWTWSEVDLAHEFATRGYKTIRCLKVCGCEKIPRGHETEQRVPTDGRERCVRFHNNVRVLSDTDIFLKTSTMTCYYGGLATLDNTQERLKPQSFQFQTAGTHWTN